MWRVAAPAPVDEAGAVLTAPLAAAARLTPAFERTWETLRRLYYDSRPRRGARG